MSAFTISDEAGDFCFADAGDRIPTGALATAQLGLSLRDASLVIIFFALLTCVPPAFMGIAGSHTGLRQLVQARYSFG